MAVRGVEREKNLNKDRYEVVQYFDETQWASYLFIIRTVIQNVPKDQKILEIGLGGGYVSILLEHMGYDVTTFDVNPNLNPTKIFDISSDTVPEEEIDRYGCVICAEVLEHIPFKKFDKCLKSISLLSKGKVIITIPDAYVKRRFLLSFGGRTLRSRIFRIYRRKKIIDIHYWELNYKKEYSYFNIREHMKKFFDIIDEGDIRNNLYHHYYICERVVPLQ